MFIKNSVGGEREGERERGGEGEGEGEGREGYLYVYRTLGAYSSSVHHKCLSQASSTPYDKHFTIYLFLYFPCRN